MNKLKMILGGTTGAIGITGAATAPLIYKSFTKVNSGGKAVPQTWPKGTKSSTKFWHFQNSFAPFLVDLDKTDDEFWKKRVEGWDLEKIRKGFQKSEQFKDFFQGDIQQKIGNAKNVCVWLNWSLNGHYRLEELKTMWQICSLDGKEMSSGLYNSISDKIGRGDDGYYEPAMSEICSWLKSEESGERECNKIPQ